MVKRVVITGYKQHELGIFNDQHPGIPIIQKALKNQLITLLEQGLEWVIVSGQLGVEYWAIEVVWALQTEYPHLQYAVMTPFIDPHQNWNDQNKEKFNTMVGRANYTVSLTSKPYEAPWQFTEKDRFFIRNSDGIILLYDPENEGTPKFIKQLVDKYREDNPYALYTITADDLNMLAEEERRNDWAQEGYNY